MKHIEQHVHDSNSRLVRSVRKYKALYDTYCPKYSLKQHTDQAWAEVAKENGQSVKECRLKWRNLRISYLRYLRQCKNPQKTVRPYYLLNEMNFMEPFVRHGGDVADNISSPKNNLRSSGSSINKPKFEYQVRSNDYDDDEDSIVLTFMSSSNKKGDEDVEVDDEDGDDDEEEEHDPIEQVYTTEIVRRATSPPQSTVTAPKQQQQAVHLHYGLAAAKKAKDSEEVSPPTISLVKDEPQQQQHSSTATAAPSNYVEQLLLELSHPDLSFFRSILPDVEQMTQAQKSTFKLTVLSTLNSILYPD